MIVAQPDGNLYYLKPGRRYMSLPHVIKKSPR